MRNEAPVIQLAEWAARVNAETRACMGVAVAPAECREARAYLAGLMTDEEAAACVAADLARVDDLAVRNLTGDAAPVPADNDAAVRNLTGGNDTYEGLSSSFAAACRKADEKRTGKPPSDPHRRRLGVAVSTLRAAKVLVRANDPKQLRQWLDRHSASERAAILRYFEQRKRMQPA